MKPKNKIIKLKTPTWRDLQQQRPPRSLVSGDALRRRWQLMFRFGLGLTGVLALATCILAVAYVTRNHFHQISPVQSNALVEHIDFQTDGVLTRAWVESLFPDLSKSRLMELDIHQLKGRIEKVGQVSLAQVSLQLPGTLKIEIREREPVLRAKVSGADGKPMLVLIARDGTVYEGMSYPVETLRRLPGLTGITLQESGGEYLPIQGISVVARLLDTARSRMPDEYGDWTLVSMKDFSADEPFLDNALEIQGRSGKVIRFAPQDFDRQLARLQQILAVGLQGRSPVPKSIDLSYRDEAVVLF